jgi:hypothetical protein
VIEDNLDADRRQELERLVIRSLRPQAPAPSWSVRMRVDSDSVPRLRIGRSELCPAVPVGMLEITRTQRVVTRSPAAIPEPPPQPSVPHFSVLVDTTGRLLQLTAVQTSGDPDFDRQFREALETHRFRPTLLDGKAVVAWTEWPLRTR